MKYFSILLLMSALVIGCGSDEEVPASPRNSPPTSQDSGKWTANELQSESTRCAQGFEDGGYAHGGRGTQLSQVTQQRLTNEIDLTFNQWFSFCQCFYQEVAVTYSYSEFSSNSSVIVNSVFNDTDAPTRCYQSAQSVQ